MEARNAEKSNSGEMNASRERGVEAGVSAWDTRVEEGRGIPVK